MTKTNFLRLVSVFLICVIAFSITEVYATGDTQSDAIGDEVTVTFFFAFFRGEPNLSFTNIKNIFWKDRKVNVLGYSGSYVYVEDIETEDKGYIHNWLINDKRLNITQQYVDVYSGDSKNGVVTIKYDKDAALEWSVSKSGIVEVTKHTSRSLSIKGLSPGTVKLTVKCGEDKDTCDISCIDKWANTETAIAESSIKIMGTPGNYYVGAKTIAKGATITARGNIPDNSNYVYVSSGKIWGFIRMSDFPGIDYVMTQYHYYDEGYAARFDPTSEKIKVYASILNDVMMANFKLKVFSYISPYTSVADECKIMNYGLVENNLSSSCPKTGNHDSNSCLTIDSLRMDLVYKYGDGDGNVSKVVWTGHMLDGNARSNATTMMGNVIITPYGTFREVAGYPSVSDEKIREDRIYTLVHETGHQFGLYDHYCRGDISTITNKCSNIFCATCYIGTIPEGCIMYDRVDIESVTLTEIYCDDCKDTILNCIERF